MVQIRYSMRSLTVLAEALLGGKANLYPKWVHIPMRKYPCSLFEKEGQLINLPPSVWLASTGNCVISGAWHWVLYWYIKHSALGGAVSALVRKRTLNLFLNFCSSCCKYFVTAPLIKYCGGLRRKLTNVQKCCCIYVIVENLPCRVCPSVTIHLRHKYLQILCQF